MAKTKLTTKPATDLDDTQPDDTDLDDTQPDDTDLDDTQPDYAKAVGALTGTMAEVGALLLRSWQQAKETIAVLRPEIEVLEDLQRRHAAAQDAAAKSEAGLRAILPSLTKPGVKRGRPAGTGSKTTGDDKVVKWLQFFRQAPAVFCREDIMALEIERNPALSTESAKQATSGTIFRGTELGVIERVERGRYQICPIHRV